MARPAFPSAVPFVPRRSRSSTLLASLLAPLLLTGVAAAPVIAQMGRSGEQVLPLAPAGGPPVRVLLASGSGWELPAQRFSLRLLDGRDRLLRLVSPDERLSLRAGGSGVVAELIAADGSRQRLSVAAAAVVLEPLAENGQPAFLAFRQERYRGRLWIRASEGGTLLAVNQLPLETYLASVVGSEMPASWPAAALQAQAVAARTYALSHRRPGEPYDVKATVASQVYRGLAAETDSTRAAVRATEGQVLMQNGKLILAAFHSSSGGSTEDSGQVWRRQLPYLVSVPDFDDSSPVSRWTVRIEPDQLARLFRETGGVRRIDVLSSSDSGRVRRARVIGPAGSIDLTGSELRQRLGLRSTLVTFSLQPAGGPAGTITRSVGGARPDGAEPAARDTSAVTPARGGALPAGSQAPLVDSATGMVLEGPPPPALGTAAQPPAGSAAAAALPAAAPRLALLVEGRGFGHGVGMSQWGAHAMALQGRSYEQILRHYYRGVELLRYPSP